MVAIFMQTKKPGVVLGIGDGVTGNGIG